MKTLNDEMIVQMYWDRNQEAINATSKKYGKYCTSIATNILGNCQDAEECVNDTYFKAWNSMPDARPNILSAFLGKITRNLAFNRIKHNLAEKRGGGEIVLVLDELSECVSGNDTVENEMSRKELAHVIDRFLMELDERKRRIFVMRYWYSCSVREIAMRFAMSEGSVSMLLRRLRLKMRDYLIGRGYEV